MAVLTRPAPAAPRPGFTRLGREAPLWIVLLPTASFAAVACYLAAVPVDLDYWWHLATGRWMLDHARVPTVDPFSYTHGGQSWYAHEWLGELVLALLNRVGGYAACILFTAVLAALALWLVAATARLYGASRRAAFLLTAGVALLSFRYRYPAVRPQVWTWTLFALLILAIARHERGHRRSLWILPPLFALWINVHLSALIGLAVLGLYGLVVAARWLAVRGTPEYRAAAVRVRHLALVSALSLLALNLNPRGPALLWFARVYVAQNASYFHYISEYRPLTLSLYNAPLYVVGGSLLLLLLAAMVRRRALWPGVLLVIAAVAGVRSLRYVPFFLLCAPPMVAWIWNGRGACSAARGAAPVRRSFTVVCSATVALAVLIVAPQLPGSEFARSPALTQGGYPVAAAAWLTRNLPDGPLFNDYDWGGYLLATFYPARRVYIDGRAEMYGTALFDRFVQVAKAEPGWQETLDRSGARAVVLSQHDPVVGALATAPGWRLAFADAVSAVYVRER